jgi:hypothetical protein
VVDVGGGLGFDVPVEFRFLRKAQMTEDKAPFEENEAEFTTPEAGREVQGLRPIIMGKLGLEIPEGGLALLLTHG